MIKSIVSPPRDAGVYPFTDSGVIKYFSPGAEPAGKTSLVGVVPLPLATGFVLLLHDAYQLAHKGGFYRHHQLY